MIDLGQLGDSKQDLNFLVKFYGKVHQEMWLKNRKNLLCSQKISDNQATDPFLKSFMAETISHD